MAQNLSNYDASLKYDYLPLVRSQLNEEVLLLQMLQKNTDDFEGSRWQLDLHHARNSGGGARGDGGALAAAGNQSYLNSYGTAKYNYQRIRLTDPVIKASRTKKGAIAKALSEETQRATNDMKKELQYQMFNDGTGVRALVNGDPGTGTTLTVDGPDSRYLWNGMLVDIVDASTGAREDDSITITSVDSSTSCTMAEAIDTNVEDNSKIIREDAHDGAGTSHEMMGMKGIVDDQTYVTTLHGIDRSSYAWWDCSTFDNDDGGGTNRDLTIDLMEEAYFKPYENVGMYPDLVIGDVAMLRAYASLLFGDKRHVGANYMNMDGGFRGLEFNGIPFVADHFCPPNTIFFVNKDHLFVMELSDFDWLDEDGSVLHLVSGYADYEAVLTYYGELATDNCRAHSFLRDISEP